MVNVTGQIYVAISFVSMPIMVSLYAITAYRGPFHQFETGERIGLSFVTAMLIMLSLLIAQFISMLIAVAPSWMDVVETIRPQVEAARAARDAAEALTP